MITLLVNGKEITFLWNTGACRTTLREHISSCTVKPKSVTVCSADGERIHVAETEPVWIVDHEGHSCQLSVLQYSDCPINLLGRDGILK